jgi:tetratricopeptide (TPR) repeat protein
MPSNSNKTDKSEPPLKLSRNKFSALSLAIIAILICLSYANSFSVPFHFDDDVHIRNNHYIRITDLSWPQIKYAAVQDSKQNRPLSNLSFALNYYFFGENPRTYHLFNLLFHVLAAVGLFFLLERTLCLGGYPEGLSRIASGLATAVWAVHPIHTQAVTYIVQRQTVMASAFILACLIGYVEARLSTRKSRKYIAYSLSAMSFILAAGCKEIFLVTPFLILLYEIFFFQKFSFAFIRRRSIPLIFSLILLAGLLALMLRPEMFEKISTGYETFPFTMKERLLTEARVVIYYLGLILVPLPSHLSLEHEFSVSSALLHPWTTILAIILILCALGWAILSARARPLISFAVLWYLLNLSLESSFLPLDLVNEHRLYLASLALIAPLSAGLLRLKLHTLTRILVPALVIALLCAFTVMRNRVWNDPLALWLDCVKKAPMQARPWNNLCAVEVQEKNYSPAILHCQKALILNPRLPDAYNNLGIAHYSLGHLPEARKAFEKALSLNPSYVIAHFNLAEIHRLKGNIPPAIAEYQETLKLNPYYIPALLNLAHLYYNQGELDQAIAQYRMVVKYSPKFAPGYLFLAKALYLKEQYPACVEVADKGLNLDASLLELWLIKASSLLKLGRILDAVDAYFEILDREPNHPDALLDLAQIDLIQGRPKDAEDKLYHVKFFYPDHPRISELEKLLESTRPLGQDKNSEQQESE